MEYALLLLAGYAERAWKGKRKRESSDNDMISDDFAAIYINWVYGCVKDCFNCVLVSSPGATAGLLDSQGIQINLGSYNYLNMVMNDQNRADAIAALDQYGTSPCASSFDNPLAIVSELEAAMVRLQRRDPEQCDCVVFPQGHGTNVSAIPAIAARDDMIFSDAKNHNSIAVGARLSGAEIVVFVHNDARDLERKIRSRVALRIKKQGKPPGNLFILIEGIYSMEGDFANLAPIVAVKKKYGALLYLDEAHSSGCIGDHGGGVCEYLNVDQHEVDFQMGTFSKSYGACGGYVVCPKDPWADRIRTAGAFSLYDCGMTGPVAAQILGSVKKILANPLPLRKLRESARKVRNTLKSSGFEVLGDDGSPVVPFIVPSPLTMADLCRACKLRGVSLVMVGYPATELMGGRIRICVSAGHTDDDIDYALKVIIEEGCKRGLNTEKNCDIMKFISYYFKSRILDPKSLIRMD